MKAYVIAYLSAGLVFLLIDAGWLYLTSERIYRPLIGHLLADKFNPLPAALFYLVYVLGIVIFAVAPALKAGHWATSSLYGACLGFVAYATYDLSNQATLRDWPAALTIVDCAWGTLLTSVSATAAFFITRTINTGNLAT